MRRFVYFVPELTAVTARDLVACGLRDRFTLRVGEGSNLIEHTVTPVDHGPDGSGCIVAAGGAPPTFNLASQNWVQSEHFWVTIEDASVETPHAEDLVRELIIGGYEIPLADGTDWTVPVIRRWDDVNIRHVPNLPTALSPTGVDGGRVTMTIVRPEFRSIDALAQNIFDGFLNSTRISIEQLFRYAVAVMGINYRLGAEEAGLLGLFNEAMALRVLRLSIDLERIEAHAKEMACTGLKFSASDES